MKFAVSIFTTLIIIIGAVLFVQYQVFSDKENNPSEDSPFTYSQEIEVVYKDGSFDIRQHFKNLPKQKIKIDLPKSVTSVECFLDAEYSCKRLDTATASFTVGETRSQSISYVVPVDGNLKSSKLFAGIFAGLKLGDATLSTIHITTDSPVKGTWVTGLPLVGSQQLSLVNYTMFSGEGTVKDLYWDSRALIAQSVSPSVTLYTEQPITAELKNQIATMPLIDNAHLSVVATGNNSTANRILYLKDMSEASIRNNLLFFQLNTKYTFEEGFPIWLKSAMISFLTDIPITNEKAQQVVSIIQGMMSDTQKQQWKEQLSNLTDKKITPKLLDKELSKVLGSSTNYFTKNSGVDTIYPFYFVDNREVYIGDEKIDLDIILSEGKVLYKAQPLLEALGYKAYEGENGYYVNSETRIFRFPEAKHGFYVFNQRRYNTTSEPIIKLQNEYFVEETWMQRLFLVELSKTEDKIQITSMDAETE